MSVIIGILQKTMSFPKEILDVNNFYWDRFHILKLCEIFTIFKFNHFLYIIKGHFTSSFVKTILITHIVLVKTG